MQRTHAGDEHASLDAHSVLSGRLPDTRGFIPSGFQKPGVQADLGCKSIARDAALEIIVNFLLARVHARPIGGWFEGKGIEMGRNIAGAARITVVVPRSADVVTFLV